MKDGSEFGRQLVEDSYFDDVSAFCASCSTFRSFTGRQSVDVMYKYMKVRWVSLGACWGVSRFHAL